MVKLEIRESPFVEIIGAVQQTGDWRLTNLDLTRLFPLSVVTKIVTVEAQH